MNQDLMGPGERAAWANGYAAAEAECKAEIADLKLELKEAYAEMRRLGGDKDE